jgi:predicted SAM-dependent methyltransferase
MNGQMKQLKEIKLHLGCGNKHIDGYINIDVRHLDGVDLIDNIKELKSFETNSVDVIYASHVLEHFGRNEYMSILTRWYDLLKDGGILRVAVPDFEKIVEHYSEFRDLKQLRGFLYGGQNYNENYHYCVWDFKQLEEDLKYVGFKYVTLYDWRKTEHSHVDDFSQSYLPHMNKQNGKLMSLNVEALK